jgi:hypothetical protein
MKYSDEPIDRVLAGLRNVEVPTGMEDRIVAAAQSLASTKSASTRLPGKPLWLLALTDRQRAWRAASAVAVAAIVAAVAVTAIHRHPATQSELHSNPAVLQARDLRTEEPDARLTPRTPVIPTRSRLHTQSAHLVAADSMAYPHRRRSLSQPAPEAPLTQQEKLLRRIAQSGNPHELAMLNSEVRTRREAQEDAEFQEFVERSIASSKGGGE